MSRKIVKGGDYRPNISVTRGAKDALATWIDANHRPLQESIVSAMILWFVEQPKSMQQIVLGQIPPEMRSAYAAAIRELADDVERNGISLEPGVVLPKKQPAAPDRVRAAATPAGSGSKSR